MKKDLAGRLYVWVLIGIATGVVVGAAAPELGVALKPLGDGFIKLIRMLVPPVIFLTVVLGISHMRDLRGVGRIGLKALVYFEVLSTVALIVGLVVVNTLKPGAGLHVDAATLDAAAVSKFAEAAHHSSPVEFLLAIIPTTLFSALTSGELLRCCWWRCCRASGCC